MNKKNEDFSMQDALKLARSEAGQQLFQTLQTQDSQTINTAMEQATAGDYTSLKQTLSGLLASPQVQAMLEQLRGQNHE